MPPILRERDRAPKAIRCVAILSLMLVICLSACAVAPRSPAPVPLPRPGGPTTPVPAPTDATPHAATSSPWHSESPDFDPSALIAAMTPEEKAGQLVMVAISGGQANATVDKLVTAQHVGSVMYLSGTWTAARTTAVSAHYAALPTPQGIGLWIAVDQEGGRVQRLKGKGFTTIPSAAVQGTWSADKLERSAREWGTELAKAGVNLDLAPVTDTVPQGTIAQNKPIGALNRQFSTDPDKVARQATAFVTGMHDAGVATTIKHFPGLGRIRGNTDYAESGITDTVTTADDAYVKAFSTAMKAKPAMVMMSLATYSKLDPDNPAAFSHAIVTDLLRDQLGWKGVVISDSFDAAAVANVSAGQRAVRFVQAGGDIALFTSTSGASAAVTDLAAKARQSKTFAADLDASVARVLEAKHEAGLIDD